MTAEWQPIETAPADIAVLIFCPDRKGEWSDAGCPQILIAQLKRGHRRHGYMSPADCWLTDVRRRCPHSQIILCGCGYEHDLEDFYVEIEDALKPTHWMPLPPPAAASAIPAR